MSCAQSNQVRRLSQQLFGWPGPPPEWLGRLGAQNSLRDPPIKRSSGGIGGLGLIITQHLPLLHGGSLALAGAAGRHAALSGPAAGFVIPGG